jgi:hypothetical protein
MLITEESNFYKVSLITGPRHNLLMVAFSDEEITTSPSIIEAMPSIGDCHHSELKPDVVLDSVLRGVADANQHFATNFQVVRVRYVENDTPPADVYYKLAWALIEYLVE